MAKARSTPPITQDLLRQLVKYDAATGAMSWLRPTSRRITAGALLNTDHTGGYLYGRIAGFKAGVHRWAWLYVFGTWPPELDHINGVKTDNRLNNLRIATRKQNTANVPLRQDSSSGFKGVSWHKEKGRWRAHITVDGRHLSLGYHSTPELAHQAYLKAANIHFGPFMRAS
jgi:hypothetical protein